MPRRLAAGALSLLLSLIGEALVFFGAVVAVAVLAEAAQAERSWAGGVGVALIGVAVLVAGVLFIGRVRPWIVRRLAGVEVTRLPWLLAAMWNGPEGAYSGGSGGGEGGAGGGC